MAATKRKDAPTGEAKSVKKHKSSVEKPAKENRKPKVKELVATDTVDEANDFGGFSGEDEDENELAKGRPGIAGAKPINGQKQSYGTKQPDGKFKLDTSSAEAHAKQRQLAKERKASKPNADSIQRSKQLWEQLRRKSHVKAEERKKLVAELFTIINGRVRDFVFKHDSVRPIQCALKYANSEQRVSITKELQADIRTLAESRYGKFLVAKMVVSGDQPIRDMIVPQFYGHVRRLVNHPEASWIVDDIYRQIATPSQKAVMLREWYGAEFALENKSGTNHIKSPTFTADLGKILDASPEKRKPMLQYLHQLINSLIQKKMTGFTMLHDAMLQYFLALQPGSEDHRAFIDEMMGDIDKETEGGGGDLFKNLAFTKSGHRLVCLALAYGTAKDRKIILRVFRDTVEMMAYDQYAKMVLTVGLDVPDDTQMSTKSILRELVGEKLEDETQRLEKLEAIVCDRHARLPVLYPMAGMAKWLLNEQEKALLQEVHNIRETTSKKAPEVRRKGLLDYLSGAALELVCKKAESLVKSSFGCQFMTEALLACNGERKEEAKNAVAQLAAGDPTEERHVAKDAAAGRMLKTLVLGGAFDPKTKKTVLAEPRLGFADVLYPVIKDQVSEWACSDSSFVVVAFLESDDLNDDMKKEVVGKLKKSKKRIEAVAKVDNAEVNGETPKSKRQKTEGSTGGNAGAKILLEKIAR